jgi:hypothetical protein
MDWPQEKFLGPKKGVCCDIKFCPVKLEKTVSPGLITPAGEVTVKLRITNRTNKPLKDLVLKDLISECFAIVSNSFVGPVEPVICGNCSNLIVWKLPCLEPGQTVSFSFRLRPRIAPRRLVLARVNLCAVLCFEDVFGKCWKATFCQPVVGIVPPGIVSPITDGTVLLDCPSKCFIFKKLKPKCPPKKCIPKKCIPKHDCC